MPVCSTCGKDRPRRNYSNRQLKKKQGRKCNHCIQLSTPQKQKGWIKCNAAPKFLSQITQLDEFNFIAVSTLSTFHIFNALKQDWIHPNNLQYIADDIKSISVHQKTKILYIIATQNNKAIILRYKWNLNYEFSALSPVTLNKNFTETDLISSVFVKDKLHILHSQLTDRYQGKKKIPRGLFHFVYHPDSQELKLIAAMNCLQSHNPTKAVLIYLPQKNQLFFYQDRHFKLFDNKDGKWSDYVHASSRDIAAIINKDKSPYIITRDNRYMIFFGCKRVHTFNFDGIRIINTKVKHCRHKAPRSMGGGRLVLRFDKAPVAIKGPEDGYGEYVAFLTQHFVLNDRMICGYFRSCWNFQESVTPILPFDIVQLIAMMEENKGDVVHLIGKDGVKHFKISVKNIANFGRK